MSGSSAARIQFTLLFSFCLLAGIGLLLVPILTPDLAIVPPRIKAPYRVIVLGFDGMDADLTEQWMAEGKLPHLRELALDNEKHGGRGYSALNSSNPSESPVSWSCMITGMNPGKTNLFDFLRRKPEAYDIENAMVDTSAPAVFDPLMKAVPIKPPDFRNYRMGDPLWELTTKAGVRTVVLEAPVSFPPDRIPGGYIICGLGVGDVRGTQGTYTFYTTDPRKVTAKGFTEFGGRVKQVFVDSGSQAIDLDIIGPPNRVKNPGGLDTRLPVDITLKATLRPGSEGTDAILAISQIDGSVTEVPLNVKEWSDFVAVRFAVTEVVKIDGLFRLYLGSYDLKATVPQVELYVTPIGFDPRNPPLPISYPAKWSKQLADEHGLYKTVGWPSETWGLNEHVLDEDAFLADIQQTQAKWEEMLFGTLAKDDWDFVFAVTQQTDHIAHMFWRFFDPTHPAYDAEKAKDPKYNDAILHAYQRADAVVGRVMKEVADDERTIVIVVSDHGFNLFRRAVNVNRWLINNGYMTLKSTASATPETLSTAQLFGGEQFFVDVDWSKTKAYAMGLGQIYLNLAGREGEGIVAPGEEAEQVKADITAGLLQLRDAEHGNAQVFRQVFDGAKIYHGPAMEQAPDLVMGFNNGYRVSWQTSLGGAPLQVIEDNTQPWSGDHCSFDPEITKGICFTNWTIDKADRSDPSVLDVAPSVLRVFDLPIPASMDGSPLFSELPARTQ